jgi:hypothetical protein
MQLLRLLEERGYPARFSHIETFGPAGRSERFEAYIPAEKTFGIVKRVRPGDLGRVISLVQRCDRQFGLWLRLGISPKGDDIDVVCRGQLDAQDMELLRTLRLAVKMDICEIFTSIQNAPRKRSGARYGN